VHSAAGSGWKANSQQWRGFGSHVPQDKILVVDDQMAVALMMVFLLTRAGCEAQAALSAEKALRLAQTEAFDLITLDVGMPDLDGFLLFQKLRQSRT